MLLIVLQAEKVQLLSQNFDEVMGRLGHLLSTAELVGRPPSQREIGQLGCELGRTIGVSPSAGAALPRPRTTDLAATVRQLDMESAAVAPGHRTTEQALQLQLRQTQHEVGWLRQALAAQPLQPQMEAAAPYMALRPPPVAPTALLRQALQPGLTALPVPPPAGAAAWAPSLAMLQQSQQRQQSREANQRLAALAPLPRAGEQAEAGAAAAQAQEHPVPTSAAARRQWLQVARTQQGYYVSHHETVTGMCIEIQVEEGLSH